MTARLLPFERAGWDMKSEERRGIVRRGERVNDQ
jgi:hypothetical protein